MSRISGYKGQRLKRPYYGGGRQKLNLSDEELKKHKEELRKEREQKKKQALYCETVKKIVQTYKTQSGLRGEVNPILIREISTDLEQEVKITRNNK